ncbi:hypothetical protein L3V86_02490 [Thiotrichales bacterium 19S11-10]|nr:hypothetical protein [Thiotrichales bacterium 19S11-10]
MPQDNIIQNIREELQNTDSFYKESKRPVALESEKLHKKLNKLENKSGDLTADDLQKLGDINDRVTLIAEGVRRENNKKTHNCHTIRDRILFFRQGDKNESSATLDM